MSISVFSYARFGPLNREKQPVNMYNQEANRLGLIYSLFFPKPVLDPLVALLLNREKQPVNMYDQEAYQLGFNRDLSYKQQTIEMKPEWSNLYQMAKIVV